MDITINDDHLASQFDIFSPYFDGKDIEICFSATAGGQTRAKAVSAKKTSRNFAFVYKASYQSDNASLKFRRRSDGVELEIKYSDDKQSAASFLRWHKLRARGDKVDLPRVSRINSPDVALAVASERLGEKLSQDKAVLDAIYSDVDLPPAVFIGPLRAVPERYYSFKRKYSTSGGHFATLWMDIPQEQRDQVREYVRDFGMESGLFDDISIRPLDPERIDAPLFVDIDRHGRKFTMDQVGVGVSQVIPILVQTAFARVTESSAVILVQQPELHLHPRAQAALGSYIAACARDKVRFVIETHSDFFIDRFRAELRDQGGISGAKIVFCQNEEIGNSATEIKINDDGSLLRPPSTYREFFKREFARTLF
jgi:hypothetical protein